MDVRQWVGVARLGRDLIELGTSASARGNRVCSRSWPSQSPCRLVPRWACFQRARSSGHPIGLNPSQETAQARMGRAHRAPRSPAPSVPPRGGRART